MPASYEIVTYNRGAMLIRDLGPWSKFQSVTNAAEEVVAELVKRCESLKTPLTKLEYIDSEGNRDEILIKDGKFAGFAPGSK